MPDAAPASTPEVVISEFMDPEAVEWLAARRPLVNDPSLVDDRARLLALGAGVRALIVRNRTRVDAALLDSFPDLAAVGRLGVGLDNIELDACKARGVSVHPALGGNTDSVAEYVITATLMLRRGAFRSTGEVLAGDWPRTQLMGREVSGATLGLIGFGAIARAVAARASALGMEVVAHDPFLDADDPAWAEARRATSIDSVLEQADVISLHVPLTPDTRGLIDADAIGRMREHAILINTARGGIVAEDALAAALADGRLGGAALDVFADEPLQAGSPLARAPNLIATPHIAGITHESNVRIGRMTAEAVDRTLAGGA